MAVYMADENGDWWGTNGKTNTLYVFDTDKLTLAQKIQIIDEWGWGFDLETNTAEEVDEMLADCLEQDKFEKLIWEYGKEITIQL